MGMDFEQPLTLNNGDSLHIIYTEDGQVGVPSKLYKELHLEALEIAHRDAVRVITFYNAYHNILNHKAFIEAQRDDFKLAVHTSPDGEPTIMSKKQFGDWAAGYTGGYLRAYPYITMDDLRKNTMLTVATDDEGNEVTLPYLIIPKTE